MILLDDCNLYFVVDYFLDIWNVKRSVDGDWDILIIMKEVSIEKDDWYVILLCNQNFYFINGIVFKFGIEQGKYRFKIKLDSEFNIKDIRDFCIFLNEDYFIFVVIDSLNFNQSDFFISFVKSDGSWIEVQNLGLDINIVYLEIVFYILFDERFLFFFRREKWQYVVFLNVYWVDLKVIEQFRFLFE